MKEKYIQIIGLALSAAYGLFIIFLYAAAPRSLEEISIKAQSAVESTVTKGQILAGTYEVDQGRFGEGLKAFRADNFVLARDSFERADPEKRDDNSQFYIAYSYYRQGWGRVSNDDALFKLGLESVNRVTTLNRDFSSKDTGLTLKTPAELRNEFEEGLRVTADDFNPFKVLRERK
ncbi:MAG: hypothetical protein ABIU09_08510 [Pyrinomonadaceae bacterium]